jgi:hypothetical protein
MAGVTLTRHQRQFLDAATAIRGAPPDRIVFLHTVQCQCGIPYKNPDDAVREWDRKQGNASLRIEAGSAIDPQTGEFKRLRTPYGEKPRVALDRAAEPRVFRELGPPCCAAGPPGRGGAVAFGDGAGRLRLVAQRLHRVPTRKPQFVSWAGLQ